VKPEAFKKDIPSPKALLLPFYYGFPCGSGNSEQDVYKMLTVIEKRAGDLAAADIAFKQIKENMPEFQRRGVEASVPIMSVHPGLAKYMKEKKVWDAKWDARIAKPIGMTLSFLNFYIFRLSQRIPPLPLS